MSEQYIPPGYYLVEDADGERLVKKDWDKTKPCPPPWRVDGGRCGPKSDHLMIAHGGTDTFSPIVAEVMSDGGRLPRDANAAFIVRAVNNHDRLMSALQTALDVLLAATNWTAEARDPTAEPRRDRAESQVRIALEMARKEAI